MQGKRQPAIAAFQAAIDNLPNPEPNAYAMLAHAHIDQCSDYITQGQHELASQSRKLALNAIKTAAISDPQNDMATAGLLRLAERYYGPDYKELPSQDIASIAELIPMNMRHAGNSDEPSRMETYATNWDRMAEGKPPGINPAEMASRLI